MARTLEEVRSDALHLPKDEREVLVDELVRSLEWAGEPSFTTEQIAEWHRRLEDLRSGRDPGHSLEEFFADDAQ
jgi:putative addiction module component (TIGR02574 family)